MLTALFTASLVLAQDPGSPFRVDAAVDIPITVGAMVLMGTPRVFTGEIAPPWCGLECDPMDINPLDRWAVRHPSSTARSVSDVLFLSSLGIPFAADALDVATSNPVDGWQGYGRDVAVMGQVLSITLAVNNMMSFVVRRPRPLVYNRTLSDEVRQKTDANWSFYSGHTAASVALFTAYTSLYAHRHPDSAWVTPMRITMYSAALTTGALRVLAGDHFPTDVAVGVVAGLVFGTVIPAVHRVDRQRPSVERLPPTMRLLSGTF